MAYLDLIGGKSEGCVGKHHIFIIGSISLLVERGILLFELNFHLCYVTGDGGWLHSRRMRHAAPPGEAGCDRSDEGGQQGHGASFGAA